MNGGTLRDALIDEVSLLVAPVVDGRTGASALFDVAGEFAPRRLVAFQSGIERGDVRVDLSRCGRKRRIA